MTAFLVFFWEAASLFILVPLSAAVFGTTLVLIKGLGQEEFDLIKGLVKR